jgi:hypothetical protein
MVLQPPQPPDPLAQQPGEKELEYELRFARAMAEAASALGHDRDCPYKGDNVAYAKQLIEEFAQQDNVLLGKARIEATKEPTRQELKEIILDLLRMLPRHRKQANLLRKKIKKNPDLAHRLGIKEADLQPQPLSPVLRRKAARLMTATGRKRASHDVEGRNIIICKTIWHIAVDCNLSPTRGTRKKPTARNKAAATTIVTEALNSLGERIKEDTVARIWHHYQSRRLRN